MPVWYFSLFGKRVTDKRFAVPSQPENKKKVDATSDGDDDDMPRFTTPILYSPRSISNPDPFLVADIRRVVCTA